MLSPWVCWLALQKSQTTGKTTAIIQSLPQLKLCCRLDTYNKHHNVMQSDVLAGMQKPM